jgi:hypothetical protein
MITVKIDTADEEISNSKRKRGHEGLEKGADLVESHGSRFQERGQVARRMNRQRDRKIVEIRAVMQKQTMQRQQNMLIGRLLTNRPVRIRAYVFR